MCVTRWPLNVLTFGLVDSKSIIINQKNYEKVYFRISHDGGAL